MLTTRQEPQRQQTQGFKRWEDLDISDDFIFTRVMRNKRLCRTPAIQTAVLPGFLGAGNP